MESDEIEEALGEPPKKREKVWKLKGGEMLCKYVGYKKRGDREMIAELQFTFEKDPACPRIVELPYNKDAIRNSQVICENSLECLLELQDCSFRDIEKEFEIFVRQEVFTYKRTRQDTGDVQHKASKEYALPQLERIDGVFYLIAKAIYRLNDRNKDSSLPYAQELSVEEVQSLPLKISYNGPDIEFDCDEEAFTRIYTDILRDFMSMQDPEFVSFLLGVSVQHLSGEFYPFIIEDHGNFSVQMVLSGEATGTGKSLAQSVHMRALKGGEICPTKSCTENEGYVILSRGEHIYVKEFSDKVEAARSSDVDLRWLKKMVQAIWERSHKRVKNKEYTPRAVIFIDANSEPDTIVPYLGLATATKVQFLATGENPLEHENQMELIQSILNNAKKLFKYLPIFLGLGRTCIMPRITSADLKELAGVLSRPGDNRQGQIIRNYDRFFVRILEMIERFEVLPLPLFATREVDRTTLLHYNSGKKEKKEMASTAKLLLIEVRSSSKYTDIVEYSARTSIFRIKVSDLGSFPRPLEKALRNLKLNPSGKFRGQKCRIIEIAERLLPPETASGLRGLGVKFGLWLIESIQQEQKEEIVYGEYFYRGEESLSNSETGFEEQQPKKFQCTSIGCKSFEEWFSPDVFDKHIKFKYHKEAPKKKVKLV